MSIKLKPGDAGEIVPPEGHVVIFRDQDGEVRAKDEDGTVREPTEEELARLSRLGKLDEGPSQRGKLRKLGIPPVCCKWCGMTKGLKVPICSYCYASHGDAVPEHPFAVVGDIEGVPVVERQR